MIPINDFDYIHWSHPHARNGAMQRSGLGHCFEFFLPQWVYSEHTPWFSGLRSSLERGESEFGLLKFTANVPLTTF